MRIPRNENVITVFKNIVHLVDDLSHLELKRDLYTGRQNWRNYPECSIERQRVGKHEREVKHRGEGVRRSNKMGIS